MSDLPPNVHVSTHPCLQAKLSLLRSATTHSRDVQALVHEIALMVGYEALARGLESKQGGTVIIPLLPPPFSAVSIPNTLHSTPPTASSVRPNTFQDKSPLGYSYTTQSVSPSSLCVVPILRSGLSMVPAISSLLPFPVPVHHLGLYRETTTLQPVEYYNNLPYHRPTSTNPSAEGPAEVAIIVDPIIATGATACAAISTLQEWGVKRIIVCGILASEVGLRKAAEEWSEGVEIWVGGCDKDVDAKGMIKPGMGDIGDRLYLTIGK